MVVFMKKKNIYSIVVVLVVLVSVMIFSFAQKTDAKENSTSKIGRASCRERV